MVDTPRTRGTGLPFCLGLAAACLSAAAAAGCNPRAFEQLRESRETVQKDGSEPADDSGQGEDMDAGDPAPSDDAGDSAAMAETDAEPTDGGPEEAGCPPRQPEDHVFRVRDRRDLGPQSMPESVAVRNLAASVSLGERVLWGFHPTRVSPEGPSYPIAAFSREGAPLALEELVSADGTPLRFLEKVAEEEAETIALFPTSLVASSGRSALLFFTRIYLLLPVSVGIARVDEEGLTTREPDYLFNAPEPLFHAGGFAHDGFVYLYGLEYLENDPQSPRSAVVRAPLANATKRASYRVWSEDEQRWVADLAKRTPVLTRMPSSFSVSFNRYLGQYLAVYSLPSNDEIELRSAPLPQGPFEPLAQVSTLSSIAPEGVTFQGVQHPALSSECDKKIVVSYTLPHVTEATVLGHVTVAGETRLMEIELE